MAVIGADLTKLTSLMLGATAAISGLMDGPSTLFVRWPLWPVADARAFPSVCSIFQVSLTLRAVTSGEFSFLGFRFLVVLCVPHFAKHREMMVLFYWTDTPEPNDQDLRNSCTSELTPPDATSPDVLHESAV